LKGASIYKCLFLLLLLGAAGHSFAQMPRNMRGLPNLRGGGGGGKDSLERRDKFEDSLTLTFRYLDSARNYKLDSSIADYTTRFPIPAHHAYLGNVGTATRSLLFEPRLQSGFDAGFHAFDVYKLKPENARFYNTTRPYTELAYILGTQTQQQVEIFHTQNIRPYWNFSLQYRLVNAPGFFKNQRTNHNNYQVTSWYQSPNRRYNNFLVLNGNVLQSGENGGILQESFLDSTKFNERFSIPTFIGGNTQFGRDFFSSRLTTGNRYRELTAIMRQQYDLGRKDSLVTDSTVIPLFYPRLRFEHTIKLASNRYHFQDMFNTESSYVLDSAYYFDNYGIATNPYVNPSDTVMLTDSWREIKNDFSIYQFPDAQNLQQYFKAGIAYQFLQGNFNNGNTPTLYNLMVHGEYRNRTRNRKWDMMAFGNLYLNGYNGGDYHAYISLQRLISPKIGSLQVGFENVNGSPSFLYDTRSAFYLDAPKSFNKQNTIHFFGTISNPALKLQLKADYYLLSNYLYLTQFSKLQQESSIFNLLRIGGLKTFDISRHWKWHAELYVQQKAGSVELNVPTVFTRNRLAFEGNFFKNLYLATGLEVKYHTPYKGDNYSPLLGQFFYQDSVTISNRPDVAAYFNFRIRSFKAYIRAENLNAASFQNGGFGFRNNNLAAPGYPYPGLVIRFGVYWSFVN
jgi:hypothetical protein